MLFSAAVGDGTEVAGPPEDVDDAAMASDDNDVPTEASVIVVVTGDGSPAPLEPPPPPALAAALLAVGSTVDEAPDKDEALALALEAKLLKRNDGEGTAAGPVPVLDEAWPRTERALEAAVRAAKRASERWCMMALDG